MPLLNNEKLQKKFFDTAVRIHGYHRTIKILPVDFNKPWWSIITKQKKLVTIIVLAQVMLNVYDSLFPILIGWAISQLNINYVILVIGTRIAITLVYQAIMYINPILQIQTMYSVEYQANQFFLSVDPIFHTTRSSGLIVSKVVKGSGSYETILDIITFELLGLIVSVITVTVALWQFGGNLGVTALGMFVLMIVFSVYAQTFKSKAFEKNLIPFEDKYGATNLETLQQVAHIRSVFASNEQSQKLKHDALEVMSKTGASWRTGSYVMAISRMLYVLGLGILAIQMIDLINAQQITPVLATAALLTYINGTSSITKVGDAVKRLGRSYTRITDLYQFIRNYGKQTYPVLENQKLK